MRRSLLLALFAALAAATPARAETVTLWGCHGPDGGALPLGFTAASTSDTAITDEAGGCAAVDGAIRLAFKRPDPLKDHSASVRFATPTGVAVDRVLLGRRVTGPGYWAQTSTTPLEVLDGPGSLDGSFSAPAGGRWVELGLRCQTAGERCDAAGARVDFRFAALTVRDETNPTFTVSEPPSVAAGTFDLQVDARDSGLGVADVTATLGGRAAALERFGGRCSELSPADSTTDLPLAEDCPGSTRAVFAVDTTTVADGTQRLELTVRDGAGNRTVRSLDVRVLNHPPGSVPKPLPPPAGGVAVAPPPRPIVLAGVLSVSKRYAVSSRGDLTIEATCPSVATVPCKLALKLAAKLPGRKQSATIATARSTVKPGKRAKVKLRVSSATRAALKRKRTLSAKLTLRGATPVSVQLRR